MNKAFLLFAVFGLMIIFSFLALVGCGGKTDQKVATYEDQIIATVEDLISYRGRNNETFRFRAHGKTDGMLWGSDVYTDDADLATAAVHAGVLQAGQEGIVTVRILPGLNSYSGSPRNGVTSGEYGSWDGSYESLGLKIRRVRANSYIRKPEDVDVPDSVTGSIKKSQIKGEM